MRPERPSFDVTTEPLKVALLGCGVVGSEVVRLLHEHADDITNRPYFSYLCSKDAPYACPGGVSP